MPDFDEEYLNAEGQAYIRFDQDDMGGFHFGYVHGIMDHRLAEQDGKPVAQWSWSGNDEDHPAQGRGWAVLRDAGTLEGVICFRQSAEHSFRAQRWPGGVKPKRWRAFVILAGGEMKRIHL